MFPSEPFPCGKLTVGRRRRWARAASGLEEPSGAGLLEQYDPGDLAPTESALHLLDPNRTAGESPEDDGSSLVRIVGGRDCKDGECPWQVRLSWPVPAAGALPALPCVSRSPCLAMTEGG